MSLACGAGTEKVTADFRIQFPHDPTQEGGPVVVGLKDDAGDEVFTFMWNPSGPSFQFRCGTTAGVVAKTGWINPDLPPAWELVVADVYYDIRMNFDGSGTSPVCTFYIDKPDCELNGVLQGTPEDCDATSIGTGYVHRNDGTEGYQSPLQDDNGKGDNVASFFHREGEPQEAVGSIIDDIGVCNAASGFQAPGVRCDASAVPTPTATPTACPGDRDEDGDCDSEDNCWKTFNRYQDDTDSDGCGNACDGDYDNDGDTDDTDYGVIVGAFGTTDPEFQHREPIGYGGADPAVVDWVDLGDFTLMYGGVPGPSGTTSGTTACP
jgi:hypothetical protein